MGIIVDNKESRLAQNFLLKSKEAIAAKIARNTVKNIDISDCAQDEAYKEAARFLIVGSVETTSPTGKTKTYKCRATVDVKGKECNFASLEVLPPEE